MKKVRELLKNKRWKWTLGGVGCLLVAAILLGSTSRLGVRAESLTLGSSSVDFDTITENNQTIYLIKTADELQGLRNATAEQTNGRTFRLNQDISIAINTLATGTFAGTLDGAGHVLTITSLQLSNSTEGYGAQTDGALFQKLSGTVQNLIVEITDTDAKYTRTTKSTVTSSGVDYSYTQKASEKVTGFSNDEKFSSIHGSYSTTDENGTVYHIKDEDTNATQISTYTPNGTPSTDTFGILCGQLTANGTINQVFLNGNAVTVNRKVDQVRTKTEQAGTMPISYYYEKGEEKEQTTTALSAISLKVSDEVTTSELEAKLEQQSSAPSSNTYQLTLKNLNPSNEIEITSGLTGWKKDGATNAIVDNESLLIAANGNVTLKKTVPTMNMNVTLEGNVIERGDPQNTSLTINGGNVQTKVYSDIKLTATLEQDVCDSMVGDRYNYTLTLENKNTSSIFITSDLGLWYKGDSRVTSPLEIPVNESVVLKQSVSADISQSVTIKARLGEGEEKELDPISITYNPSNYKASGNLGTESLNASLTKKRTESGTGYTYTLTLTNLYTADSGKYIEITSDLTGWIKKDESSPLTSSSPQLVIEPRGTITFTQEVSDATKTLSLQGNLKESKALTGIRTLQISSQIEDNEKHFTATMSKTTGGYQLTLSNSNSNNASDVVFSDIEITGGLDGWQRGDTNTIQASDYPLTIKAGDNEILTKTGPTGSSVTISGKLRRRAITYTYTDKKVEKTFTAGSTAAQDTAFLTKGNELYAGGLVGTVATGGTITACKQNVDLIKINNNTGEISEGTTFGVGGILGKAESMSNISEIYLLGKVKEGDQESNSFVGKSQAVPETVALNETDALRFANNNNANWSTYTTFSSAGGTISETTYGDLAWLVKKESDSVQYFSYTTDKVAKKITAKIDSDKRITGKDLSYVAVYNARKSMTDDKEDNLYLSATDGSMDLGDSGYYRIKHVYATDGYYHYQTPVTELSNATMEYPYLTNDVPGIDSATVVRTDGSITDMVKVTMKNATDGTVYYDLLTSDTSGAIPTDTSANETITSGVVQLPFEVNDVYYRLVPVVEEKIYPALTTARFSENDRKPIPKPIVTCYNFYNSNGILNAYTGIKGDGTGSYQAGSDMRIEPQDNGEGYKFKYLFSVNHQAADWEEARYKGTDFSFFNGAVEYDGSAVIPDALVGKSNVYLYVQVEKNNYATQIYCYGPFAVTAKDTLTASVNGVASYEYKALNGDIVTITGVDAEKIESKVTTTANGSSSRWESYSQNGIIMGAEKGSYVHARIKYGEGQYSKAFLFEFTFGDTCAKPRVTPNTGESSGGTVAATSITPTTAVTLSSRTPDAQFFYRESNNTCKFSFTRVTSVPSGVTTSGTVSGNYKYFLVNGRWYQTSTDVKEYENTKGLTFIHDNKDPQLIYLSAVAVANGYEVSECAEYLYMVQAKEKVDKPEAALETQYSPDGNNIAIAPVRKGANLAFFTVTPGAKLYYAIGTGTTAPDLEVTSTGIPVTGNYGDNFVVRVQAKKDGMLDSDIISFTYTVSAQDTAMIPTATPGTSDDNPTTVIPGNKILLSSTTQGATIFYTINGDSPGVSEDENGILTATNENTKEYNPNEGIVMPLDGSGYFTIKAVAVKSGLAKSPEAHFTFLYPGAVSEPYATMDSGYVTLDSVVFLKNVTENAVIYYTVAYGDQMPEDPSFTSAVFNEEYPFTITQKTTIKAMAAKDGVRSQTATFTFIPMAQLDPPQASIDSGSVVARGTVLELKTVQGASVYYTMDGSDPLDSANTAVMSGTSVTLNGEPGAQITIKAYAKAGDKSPSQMATFTYQISQNTGGIIASIENGSLVSNGTKVNLISDVTDAEIYYTTDGSSPIDKGIKGTTVEINGIPGNTFTIKAVAVVAGEKGMISTFVYKIKERPTAPTASPSGGVLTIATRVSLSSGTELIYYTTDGTEPTKSSTPYAEPILINRATTLKAIAVSADGEVSEVAEFTYSAAPKAGTVTSSASDGSTLHPGRKISLATTTDGAVIYYSTDGTVPTMDNLDSLLVYNGDIEINRSVTLQAVAYRKDLRLSDVAVWNYNVEKIPAVILKQAEAKKLAQEGLQETDTSALARTTQENQTLPRKMKEQENNTQIVHSTEALPLMAKLSTTKEENSYLVTEKAKEIFGQDSTVLETYQFQVKDNNASVQPKEEVEVAIPIPEGYEDAVLTIAYVEDNRPLTTLETRRENEMLYAKTKKLGTFVIVGTMQEEKAVAKLTYLPILEAVAGITLLGGVSYFGFIKIQKFLKKRKKTTQRSEDNPKGV